MRGNAHFRSYGHACSLSSAHHLASQRGRWGQLVGNGVNWERLVANWGQLVANGLKWWPTGGQLVGTCGQLEATGGQWVELVANGLNWWATGVNW